MNWRKFISSVCAVMLMAATFTGCGDKTEVKTNSFDTEIESSDITDTFIAQNDNYTLDLNETTMGVTLTDTKTGKVYGTNPQDSGEVKLDELGMPIKRHPQVESVLFLEYLDVEKNTTSKLISYTAAVNSGRTVYEKTENGVKISYYFDDAKIMIPVTYTLRDNGLALSIDPNEIQETDNMLISVSVAPFWCSVENTDKDGYLLYPSGSGALIYAKEISQPGETFSDEVYGTDAAKEIWDKVTTEKAVRLPVFGAKSAKQATMGIIEEGAESSLLDVTVGSTSIGYSSVYVTYQLRGYTANIKELYNNRYYKGSVYADNMIKDKLTIGFYPLSEDDADYSSMAAVYREYLNETAGEAADTKASTLDLTFVGGTMISKSFIGIPYKTLYAATTLSEVSEIVSDLKESGVEISNLNLSGFTQNGIDSDKLGGGFKLDSKLGSLKELKNLNKTLSEQGTELYFDFDTVTFSESANGFSNYFDAAVRANRKIAKYYDFDIAVLGRDTENAASLLARDRFETAFTEVLKRAEKWELGGVGISNLSSIAYSDYSDKENTAYYAKAGISAQVSGMVDKAKAEGMKVMSSEANAYAAAGSDLIINAPTVSTGAAVFDEDIPFYQMALRGRTAISGESINLSADFTDGLLRAVESGSGVAYTLTANYSTELLDSTSTVFYNSLYSDLKDKIIENYNTVSEYYEKIGNSEITEHNILENGLRETVFDSGVRVYVNYSDKDIKTKAGIVPACGFLVGEANV